MPPSVTADSLNDTPFVVCQNETALARFIHEPISKRMVSYLARATRRVIRCDDIPSKEEKLEDSEDDDLSQAIIPSLEEYIEALVCRSHVQTPTLMTTLVYLARLRNRLSSSARGKFDTHHRIFLAALIITAKNLNDSSPENKHWVQCATVRDYPDFGFSLSDVNLMECQILFLLDWDLQIENEDLYHHLEPFLTPIR